MAVVRVRGIKRFRHKKTGVWYTYHRASGERIEPPHEFGSPAFFAALDLAQKRYEAKSGIPGTWGAAVKSYRESPEWTNLMPRTRADYEKVMDWLSGLDDSALVTFTRPRCYKLRDKAFRERKRRFANYVSTMLSIVLGHAAKHGLGINDNPAYGMDKIRKGTAEPEANIPWLEEEIAAFLAAAPAHIAAPFATAVHLGMRGEDVIRLPKMAYRSGCLYVRTSKTGQFMPFPVPAELRERLDAISPHDQKTLFVNTRGQAWSPAGFRHQVFDLRNALAARGVIRKELTLHGLRTTFGQQGAEQGLDERKIADAMGHADVKTTRGYVREAGRQRNISEVVDLVARNRKTTKLSTRLSNPDSEDS